MGSDSKWRRLHALIEEALTEEGWRLHEGDFAGLADSITDHLYANVQIVTNGDELTEP